MSASQSIPIGTARPVIRNADGKTSRRSPSRFTGGGRRRARRDHDRDRVARITIFEPGGIGGNMSHDVNGPGVAILGWRARPPSVWREEEFVPRQMLPLSLSTTIGDRRRRRHAFPRWSSRRSSSFFFHNRLMVNPQLAVLGACREDMRRLLCGDLECRSR